MVRFVTNTRTPSRSGCSSPPAVWEESSVWGGVTAVYQPLCCCVVLLHVAWVRVSLMAKDAAHFFMGLLAICVSSSVKCLLTSFACVLTGQSAFLLLSLRAPRVAQALVVCRVCKCVLPVYLSVPFTRSSSKHKFLIMMNLVYHFFLLWIMLLESSVRALHLNSDPEDFPFSPESFIVFVFSI